MSNKIDFAALESSIEQSSPYTEICYELIKESKSNLNHLIYLSAIEEDNLIHYFRLIGGGYLSKEIIDDDKTITELEKTKYKYGLKAFEEFQAISKVTITLDQAYSLGIGIVLIEEAILEIDSISINWNKIDKFDSIEQLIKAINLANYYIGQGMGSFYKSQNMNLDNSKGIHIKGGEVRARIYEEKKRDAIKIYENGNYHTYIECGRKISHQLGVVPETIAKWLSEHYRHKY